MAIQARGASDIVKLVTLGPEAIAYMREELAHPDPLADALQQAPLEAGRVRVHVPDQANAEDMRDLRAVLCGSTGEGAQVFLAEVEFVFRYLRQGGSRALLMGSHPGMPADWRGLNRPRLGGLREWAAWVTCERRVYFFATEASDRTQVRAVFEDGQATTTFGLLAHNLSWTLTPHSDLARTQVEDLVRHADQVVVGAYDSTGTLLWST